MSAGAGGWYRPLPCLSLCGSWPSPAEKSTHSIQKSKYETPKDALSWSTTWIPVVFYHHHVLIVFLVHLPDNQREEDGEKHHL